ncbi:MAG: hypothetical protein ACOZNI_07870 [Myxococcota bacterium]
MNEPEIPLSRHAIRRASARRIPAAAIDAALSWGRAYRSHADEVFRLDRRSVRLAARDGVRLDAYEGVTVVVTPDGTIRTIWRNRRPSRIRR